MGPLVHLRLYVAGEAQYSLTARRNLDALVRDRLPDRHRIEIVDVLHEPSRALDDGVLLTPTLVRVAPPPEQRLVGDLSDSATLLQALGLGVT